MGVSLGHPSHPRCRPRAPVLQNIRDIKFITRPHLNSPREQLQSPTQRAAERVRARYKAAERALLATLSPGAPQLEDEEAIPGHTVAATVSVDGDADNAEPIDANVQLQLLFQYYCRFGRTGSGGDEEDTIDSFNFAKFTRECPGLLDRRLNPTEVDLIFVKCKAKGGRRLHYGLWLDSLSALATAKYPDVEGE